MNEIWKDIKWYEGLYKVSNMGNVMSLKWGKERILKKRIEGRGYFWVVLCLEWVQKSLKVHRLVSQAFIWNPQNKPQVNHINWIKTDNRLENLEWCTNSENQLHSYNVLWNVAIKWKDHYLYGKKWNKHPMYGRKWELNHSSKEVNQYTKEGVFLKKWGSMKMAQSITWIDDWNIWKVCKWIYKTAGWFIWKYA